MIGLVALPALFCWMLLLPGYASSLRRIVFIYAFAPAIVLIAGALFVAVIANA
jgi:hypothetical protein